MSNKMYMRLSLHQPNGHQVYSAPISVVELMAVREDVQQDISRITHRGDLLEHHTPDSFVDNRPHDGYFEQDFCPEQEADGNTENPDNKTDEQEIPIEEIIAQMGFAPVQVFELGGGCKAAIVSDGPPTYKV